MRRKNYIKVVYEGSTEYTCRVYKLNSKVLDVLNIAHRFLQYGLAGNPPIYGVACSINFDPIAALPVLYILVRLPMFGIKECHRFVMRPTNPIHEPVEFEYERNYLKKITD